MKKITIALLVLALAAMSVVNCFAADISTAVTDLDLLYFDDFSDANKYDYGASDNYIAEIDGQSLYLMTAASGMQAYMLPGAPELSGLTKATFVYSFTYDMYENMKEIGVLFGLTDESNGYFVGITPDHNNGIKSYYAPIEEAAYRKTSMDLKTCRRYGYFYTEPIFDDSTKRIKEFDEKAMYTVVIEFEVGAEPVHTIYVNGEPTNWVMAEPGGNTEYSISADTDVTLNGAIGFGLKGSGVLIDGIAVYGNTGLDHRELVAKVATEGGAAGTDTPATEAPATEAPATEAPATEAPVTEAPATEAPATEAPATEAPATEAPAVDATEAPATEAPTTEAPKAEGGCGGVIGVGAIVAILGAAVVLKKRD